MARIRTLLAIVPLIALAMPMVEAVAADPAPVHAIAMHGAPKYGPDFTHFDYVNPDAPKGGFIVNEATGTYDSFNPFILKGVSVAGIGLLYDSLMSSSSDEAFTKYANLADSAVMPEDRSWVAFNINPKAKWHDGEPVKPEDVIWTFNALREKGHPFYRAYYGDVKSVEKTGERQVTFRFPGNGNRELPLIVAEISILPKHYWESRDFTKTTLEPPLGSGAYKIKTFEAGRSIAYERVKDYWGAELPVHKGQSNIDEIRYEYYRDREVATEAFKSGAFDLRAENSAKRWATSFEFPALDAGYVVKALIPHERPTGMQGFIFNTRRPFFSDPKVRLAIAHAWDFEWANNTIMYGAYTRTNSYFSNSELASERGLPEGEELKVLERFRGKVPDEVFTTLYEAPKTDGSGNIRGNLRKALKLLREAGWRVKDGKLTNPEGEALAFEMLLAQPSMEKLALPLQQNLKRLGIEMSIRSVDVAQYQQRTDTFDFDMIVGGIGQSLSPGNEQRDFWHSSKADIQGSRNQIGIKDPVVDALVDLVIQAPDRESLVARTRALDRVLLWGHYLVPHFHLRASRLIYWNKFGRPKVVAKYSNGYPGTWWIDPEKQAALAAWRKSGGK
ncbi:MAG: extracellular solute-binding protein [Alphaproteobacteria bacterium]|nr:extracellular solute-binding protein [Alphaproteobacteria bacterium]